jgi:hypothetical protein
MLLAVFANYNVGNAGVGILASIVLSVVAMLH